MKNLFKKFTTAAVLIGSTLFASTLFVLAGTWIDPQGLPTSNNTETPINVSNKLQTKLGGLDLGQAPFSPSEGTLLSRGTFESRGNTYLATLGGSVGIGTANPGAKLDVNGNLLLSAGRSTIFTTGDNTTTHRGGVQFLTYDNGVTNIWTPTNQFGTPVNSTIRFGGLGSFNTNTVNLHVSGTINANGDICTNFGGRNKCLSTAGPPVNTVNGPESLRIVRGFINADGTISAGAGFTSRRTGPGQYTISYNTLFGDSPAVSATAVIGSGADLRLRLSAPQMMELESHNGVGTLVNTAFTFIVVGKQ